MKKSTIPYNVAQVKKMYEKSGILDFDCPIQRGYGMWDDLKKSLLVHSMLVGFVIPPFYMTKENKGTRDAKNRPVSNYSCIDGQHRLRSLFSFINDEFPLHEETPDVEIDGDEYKLAGLKFSELPEEIQQMITSYTFTIYNLEECTDEEIEEMFFRLNNGSNLSKTQIANVKLGMELAAFVKKILSGKFFEDVCHFTLAQYRRAADEKTLLQAMMLLDMKDGDYELVSIAEGQVTKYAESLHDSYSDEKRERLLGIIEYLENAFDQKEKFMKIVNIPIFIYMADEAINNGIKAEDFYKWFEIFADKYNPDCAYAQYCSTGSIKKEKVEGRISVMNKDFREYFKLDAENNSDDTEELEPEDTEENEDESDEQMIESKTPLTDDFMDDLENEIPFC